MFSSGAAPSIRSRMVPTIPPPTQRPETTAIKVPTTMRAAPQQPEENVYELPWLPGDRAFLADPDFQALYDVAHVELGPDRWLSCYGRRDADLPRLFPRARVFRQ